MNTDRVLSPVVPPRSGDEADDALGEGENAADLALPDLIRHAIALQGKHSPDEVFAAAAGEIPEPEDDQPWMPTVDPTGLRGVVCAACDQQITFADRGVLHEVTGWSKPRTEGGTNHVIGRHETGRMICGRCASLHKQGLPSGQSSLL